MAKTKSFLDMADVDNPVAQFISTVSSPETKNEEIEEKKADVSVSVISQVKAEGEQISSHIVAPKTQNVSGRTYKHVELKTRRVQLLLKQSVYDKIMRVSDNIGVSMNEFIHMLVEDYPEQ